MQREVKRPRSILYLRAPVRGVAGPPHRRIAACGLALNGLGPEGLALLLVHERVDEVLGLLRERGAVEE